MPDFIIIGAQKSGTSSLYKNLTRHPCVFPAKGFIDSKKEVRYFTRHYNKGTIWYRSHFSTLFYKKKIELVKKQKLIDGESTPSYIYFPHAAKRIFETIPSAKLILLLRNPADRAYSHYQHVVRLGHESLSFEEAISSETNRLKGEREKILADENYQSFNYMYHSYLTRGIYADQLKEWLNFFPMEQILVIKSEDYFSDPFTICKQLQEFLEIPCWNPTNQIKSNVGIYQRMEKNTKKRLLEFYKSHNERLYNMIGKDFHWD